jgi:hypothetical protein
MASATWHAFRPNHGLAPGYQWEKVLEDCGVLLCGSRGQREPRRGWYGKFAGILQIKLR